MLTITKPKGEKMKAKFFFLLLFATITIAQSKQDSTDIRLLRQMIQQTHSKIIVMQSEIYEKDKKLKELKEAEEMLKFALKTKEEIFLIKKQQGKR